MTEKARAVLHKIRQRQALKRLANSERRGRILNEFNRSTLDDVAPIGGKQGMKVLQEMRRDNQTHREPWSSPSA